VAQTARLESSMYRGTEGCFAREGQGNPHLSQKAQGNSKGNSRDAGGNGLENPPENRQVRATGRTETVVEVSCIKNVVQKEGAKRENGGNWKKSWEKRPHRLPTHYQAGA